MPDLSRTSLKIFFVSWSEISEQASRQIVREEPNKGLFCKHVKRRNWRYCNVSTDENPQRENDMDTPSFEALHAHIFKLKDGEKKQTKLTLV